MLPLVLACYEFWFGRRRWLPLVPFFLVSLSFGVQGLLLNPNKDNDYTFRFTLPALSRTIPYYASRVFLLPWIGLMVLPAALLAGTRRAWFGMAMMVLLIFPLLFLPGRLFSAYCYVPFTGLAILLTGLAALDRPVLVAAFFLLWLPADYRALRAQRNVTLARDADVREWVTTVARFASAAPPVDAFVYSGTPDGFEHWGVEGALKYVFHRGDLTIRYIDDPGARDMLRHPRVALLAWDGAGHKLEIARW
jgi:hypothetical protein